MTPDEFIPKIIEKASSSPQLNLAVAEVSNFFGKNLGLLKGLSLLVSAAFLFFGIFFMVKTGWLQLRTDRIQNVILKKDTARKRSVKGWKNIQKHFFSGTDSELKVAIIEADNLLDEALRTLGFKAMNLGERLKMLTTDELENLDEVWEAHRLRNKIAHESDFKMNRDIAERALGVYERAFRNLGVLD